MYDAHIHLDRYPEAEQQEIILQEQIDGLIAVAMDSKSAQSLIKLNQYDKVHIALGFHPEQQINEHEINHILSLIDKHHTEIIGIGEVGLPQYLNREHSNLDVLPYIDVLERFIIKAKEYNLPVILHAVYDDTLIALELLKKHNINKAHFHWFKASDAVINRLLNTNYMVSVTPDILHNPKTRKVVSHFPLNRIMIETDGPWPHDGYETYHIHQQLSAIIKAIACIKSLDVKTVQQAVTNNTKRFYNL
ncbi:TatD family hydrolase [Macrococcoides caseolyticum]|uniref:TatD family hydrolase n=1 Tax=Macrococcoides caseolyticum TaxID=69966 RepID=UPI001F427A9C|nr:TatD family hydrolase [Macrococcus caseolyticus]MCE4955937.1 TatD family hydrolase [Macrococcus caseolyticus]